MTRRNRRPGSYLLLLGSVLFALALAEVLLRVYEGYFVEQGIRLSATGVDLGANNFNDGFVPFERPEGEFRVLSLGDSFAFATVRYPWSYHAIAGNRASAGLDDASVRLVNLGEPAISFAEYLFNYRFWSQHLEHDAVLFLVFIGNDLLRVRKRKREDINRVFADMEFDVVGGERRLGRVPEASGLRLFDYLYALWGSWASRAPEREEQDDRYNFAVLTIPEAQFHDIQVERLNNYDPSSRRLDAGYEQAQSFFEAVGRLQSDGVWVLVALAPDQLQVDAALRDATLLQEGREAGEFDFELPNRRLFELRDALAPHVPMIDLLPAFACAETDDPLYRLRDTHWSVAGNRLAGEVIAEAMRWYWFEEQAGQYQAASCEP